MKENPGTKTTDPSGESGARFRHAGAAARNRHSGSFSRSVPPSEPAPLFFPPLLRICFHDQGRCGNLIPERKRRLAPQRAIVPAAGRRKTPPEVGIPGGKGRGGRRYGRLPRPGTPGGGRGHGGRTPPVPPG